MLPRAVVVLGLVSFLNDAASEMIAPILPVFLTAVLGAGPALVGFNTSAFVASQPGWINNEDTWAGRDNRNGPQHDLLLFAFHTSLPPFGFMVRTDFAHRKWNVLFL